MQVTFSQNSAIIGIKAVSKTQRRCFLCKNENGRARIPESAVLQVLRQLLIFIPSNNRICKKHVEFGRFTDDALRLIKSDRESFIMDGDAITKWMKTLVSISNSQSCIMDFSKNSQFKTEDFMLLLGVTKSQFLEIFEKCKKYLYDSKNRSRENALAILLMKLRLDLSQAVLALLFGFKSQASVSSTISKVAEVVDKHYASLHVGYEHITREEALTHTSEFFHQILQTPTDSLHLTIDGTYIDIQKPSNFELQRQTYSLHKHKNLVKPVMTIFDDGYIYSPDGIWFCDAKNNDSSILNKILDENGPNSMRSIMEEGDSVLGDRGYRDSKLKIEAYGFKFFMPALLSKGAAQFSTEEANMSRQVTMLRCGVEMTNGQVKQHFRFLDHRVQNSYLPQLPAFVRITCAIHNHFGTRIREFPKNADEIVATLHKKMDANNDLQTLIEEEGLQRKSVCWETVNATTLDDFPVLSQEDVERIMLGTFQVKISKKYTEQQMDGEAGYNFYVHKERDDLFRAKLKSRFNRRTTHQVWIQTNYEVAGFDGIQAYYCTCKTGARTVGSCSHVASVRILLKLCKFVFLLNQLFNQFQVLMHFGLHRGHHPSHKRKTRALSLLDAAVNVAEDLEDV